MSLLHLNHFPTENGSWNIIPLFCVALCVVDFFAYHVLLKFLARSVSSVEPKLGSFQDSKDHAVKNSQNLADLPCRAPCSSGNREEDGHVRREDLEVLMKRLGISCDPEGADEGRQQEKLGPDEISNLFEEKGPSVDEVKAAFDVFDENGDGFIEAKELQRVLCVLGFEEGSEVENCRGMIDTFDEDGDGRIDFGEFVKFMENTFC